MNGNRNLWMLALALVLIACGSDARACDVRTAAGTSVGWRGNGAGLHGEAKPPLEWSDRRNILWRAKVGKGNSSPITVGERVLVTAEPDKLICFDAARGKILWQRTNGAADLPVELRKKDLEPLTECGYATPTPYSDGRAVYALYGNGVVACYGLDGRRKWITLIDIEQTEQHGRSASPVVVGDRLIVHVSDLFCLDARTGKTLWRRAAKTAFGTPLPVRIGTVDVIVTPRGDVFRVRDGKKLATAIASVPVASPVAHDGVVYFIGSLAQALRLPARIEGDKLGQVRRLWRAELPGKIYASPLVHGGLIYTVTKRGKFLVLDAANGRTVRSESLKVKSECAPSPALAGKHVFLHTDAGRTFIFQPGPQGRQVAANALGSGSVATPAFAGRRIFLRCEKALVCIQAGAQPTTMTAKLPPKRTPTTRPRSQSTSAFMTGWRGNGTGLYPNATPVVHWSRRERGVVAGLKTSAARPQGDGPGKAPALRDNFPRRWLVIGPMPAPKGLDTPALPNEGQVRPAEGDRLGQLAWKRCDVPEDILPPSERASVAGATSLRFVEPAKVLGDFKPKHLVYAHTYLHSAAGGEVTLVVGHGSGLMVRLNGREVYKQPKTHCGLSWYTLLSRFRTGLPITPSPRVRLRLRKGSNRLLLKIAHGRGNWDNYKFNPRIVDLPGVRHEQTNILWASPLPDRSSSTPIIVGNRIFVMAEPEQLLCLDKAAGRLLWTRFLGRYQATPKNQRDANPAFKEKLDPLVAKLPTTWDLAKRLELRRQIDAALVAIDAKKYRLDWDGHMRAHFRIVGWTLPTPVSDGKSVYAYCGNGVAACYGLDGTTRWIRRVNPGQMHYPASPALVDGKLVLFASGGFNMVALDAATGKVAWRQPKVDQCVGALIGARINGVGVVISQKGDVVRAADGHVLYANPLKRKGDTGWAPPVCIDNVVYLPWSGVGTLLVKDFRGATGDQWTCRRRDVGDLAVSRDSKRRWVDRWTCGSPLIFDGLYYNIDVFGTLYAADLKTRKVLYRRDLSRDFNMLTHYNAVGVSASITLAGKHLLAMDNQGTTVVFAPGRTFKKVAVNRIERQIHRPWPIRPQEEIGYSPPLAQGARIYLRGERFLYCIGKD